MLYKHAKRLHTGDEVIIKKTGEISRVIETEILPKIVLVTCVSDKHGTNQFTHKELS